MMIEKAHEVEVSEAGVHVCRVCGYWGMRPPPIPCTVKADKPTTCPTCQTVHTAGAVVAVGRFDPTGPQGYRTRLGGPIRATRAEADRDLCTERRDLVIRPAGVCDCDYWHNKHRSHCATRYLPGVTP